VVTSTRYRFPSGSHGHEYPERICRLCKSGFSAKGVPTGCTCSLSARDGNPVRARLLPTCSLRTCASAGLTTAGTLTDTTKAIPSLSSPFVDCRGPPLGSRDRACERGVSSHTAVVVVQQPQRLKLDLPPHLPPHLPRTTICCRTRIKGMPS